MFNRSEHNNNGGIAYRVIDILGNDLSGIIDKLGPVVGIDQRGLSQSKSINGIKYLAWRWLRIPSKQTKS